jgi:hypothetical protein
MKNYSLLNSLYGNKSPAKHQLHERPKEKVAVKYNFTPGGGTVLHIKSAAAPTAPDAVFMFGEKQFNLAIEVDGIWNEAGPGWQTITVLNSPVLGEWNSAVAQIEEAGNKAANAEISEYITGAVAGGYPKGGTGFSYDAVSASGMKIEVKYQASLGSGFRTGATGRSTTAVAFSELNTFLTVCHNIIEKIDTKLEELKTAHLALTQSSATPYEDNPILVRIRELLKNIVEMPFGKKGGSSETNLTSITRRGELALSRLAKVGDSLVKLEQVLEDCLKAAEASKRHELAQVGDLIAARGDNALSSDQEEINQMRTDKKLDIEDAYNVAVTGRMSSQKRKQAQIRLTKLVGKRAAAAAVEQIEEISSMNAFICGIESEILNHPYFDDLEEGQTRGEMISSYLLQDVDSQTDLIRDYMNASEYAETEKEKKQIGAWAFMVGGSASDENGALIGATLHILTKEGAVAAMERGDMKLTEISTGSPKFTLVKSNPSKSAEEQN